jgi:hypothetical protein
MIDWSLERYRVVIGKEYEQDQQNNENDLVIINKVIEQLYEKKKIAKKP